MNSETSAKQREEKEGKATSILMTVAYALGGAIGLIALIKCALAFGVLPTILIVMLVQRVFF